MESKLIVLISKINDRNIQKRRESGFTVYALTSIVIILTYYLIETLLSVSIRINFSAKLTFLSLSFNVCFGLLFIYYFYAITQNDSTAIKLIKRDERKESIIENFCEFSMIFIPMILSFFVLYLNLRKLDWYFYVINIVWILILLIFFIPTHKKISSEYEVIEYKTNSSDRDIFAIIIYIMVLILLISPIIYYTLNIGHFAFPKLGFIKIAAILILLPLIFSKIFDLNKHDLKSGALEKLESEVYLNDLSDIQIKEILQDNYLGIGFENWIKIRKEHIIDFKNEIITEILNIRQFIEETEQIESKYIREINARKEEIKERLNVTKQKNRNFFHKEINEIKAIINDSRFNEIERGTVDDYLSFVKDNISVIKNEFKSFEKK